MNTVGGFANWVQDWEDIPCPHCGKPMKYLAQIQWDTVNEGTEGTLYIEFCSDRHIVSMQNLEPTKESRILITIEESLNARLEIKDHPENYPPEELCSR